MTSNIGLLIILFLSVAGIVAGTSRLKIHPFLVLLAASYFAGIAAGIPLSEIASVVSGGFGSLMGSIGLVIVLGTFIGVALEKSGAAIKIADIIILMAGRRFPTLAMSMIGYLVSIPVFCDSAYVILSSVRKSLALRTGIKSVTLSVALATGLYATHTLVPPTPGPIAAAGNLGMEEHLGRVILLGLAVAVVAMLTGTLWAVYAGRKFVNVSDKLTDIAPLEEREIPAAWKAILPIMLPIFLIALRSAAQLFPGWPPDGLFIEVINFAGQPINALALGLVSVLLLFPARKSTIMRDWIKEGILVAAPILLITGAGGAFGAVLRETRIGDALGTMLAQYQLGIFLPFVVAALFKTAQGSSTVAMVATSALMAPLLASMGLESHTAMALVILAIGAGSMTVSHANDSYFWVVTQFSGMDVATGYRAHTTATLLQGTVSMAFIWLLSLVLL